MNGKLDQRFAHGGPMKALEQRRVAEWLQAVNRPFEPSGLRREARRRAEAEREWRHMRRWLAVYCGGVGVALIVLCWPGGCSLVLGMALVVAGAALW